VLAVLRWRAATSLRIAFKQFPPKQERDELFPDQV